MSYCAILRIVTQFQTLIVGTLGFIGVIITLLTNARLQRKQHDRQVLHDANALRIALRAELEILRDAFLERISTITQAAESSSILVPLDTMNDVFSRVIDRIGLLSEREVSLVLRAYILVRQMPERITLIARKHATEREMAHGYAAIGSDYFDAVRKIHENYLVDINAALSALARK